MSSSKSTTKCKHCGSSEIEVDSTRGESVCTNCGGVLEDSIIVSEVQFEEGGHGTSSAIGQFVSSESKGGSAVMGRLHISGGQESREVTLRKARNGISHLCHQLNLQNNRIDIACNYFKMALHMNLTRGRRNTHIYAACVYLMCRTEETSHLLIDISDVLQICCYELGRTYLKLATALCIKIPTIDPCIYIMRFAHKLELAAKTHEVSQTAQRLVQRMKKDSIHSGRRPSGLCGAALLLASRFHGFNRTPNDIVKIVKIHESTLRKRLIEFGETPTSALTLEEFLNVDLEAEQDPPSFKAARKKDKERIARLQDAEMQLTDLQLEIEAALDKQPARKSRKRCVIQLSDVDVAETDETSKFIEEETLAAIEECLADNNGGDAQDGEGKEVMATVDHKRPDLEALCMPPPPKTVEEEDQQQTEDLDLTGIDDDELDGYIMTPNEAAYKDQMWNKLNAEYLKLAKEREERQAKEREEGKPEKKKRRTTKKKPIGPSNTAGEAIEKMLQEKKISNKINYDILKALTEPQTDTDNNSDTTGITVKTEITLPRRAKPNLPAPSFRKPTLAAPKVVLPSTSKVEPVEEKPVLEEKPAVDDDDYDEDYEDQPEDPPEHSSLKALFETEGDDEYYGYDDY